MATFQDETSGLTVEVPDSFSPEQTQSALQQAAERFLTKRGQRIGSLETQAGGPLQREPPTEGTPFPNRRLSEFELPAGTRFDVARSVTAEGAAKKVTERFPEIEVKVLDDPEGGQLVALRRPGEEAFALLDSDELFTFGDIVEMGGELFSLETLGAVIGATKTIGKGLLTRMFGVATGAGGGRASDVAVEQARGFERFSLEQIGEEAAFSGTVAAVSELLFAPFRRAAKTVTGRGIATLTPEEEAAERTAREMGTGLTLGQVVPIAKRIEQQAAATSKVVQQNRLDQLSAVLRDLDRLGREAGDFSGLDDASMDRIIQDYERGLFSLINVGAVDPAKGGAALKEGRREFVKAYKQRLDRLYGDALALYDGLELDVSEAVSLAQSFRTGVRAKGKAPKAVASDDIVIDFDNTGRVLMRDADGKPVRVTIDPEGKLAQLVNALAKLDPNVRTFESLSAFEQIKALRSDLFDLKNSALPGQERIDNRIAGMLYDALSEAMENPIGEGSDAAVRAYRRASLANRRKEQILEVADLKLIAQTSDLDTDGLVRQIAQPYNGSALRLLGRIMPREQFEVFKKTFQADLASKPEAIVSRLDAFRADPRALRMLLTPDEEATFRVVGQRFARLKSGPVQKAYAEIADFQERATFLVEKSDATQITEFILRSGGKSSSQGRALRAGAFASLRQKSREVVQGREVIDIGKFMNEIARMEDSGKLAAIFTPDEVAILKSRRDLASFLDATADPGASIQAAEAAAGAFGLGRAITSPRHAIGGFLKGVGTIANNAMIGRLFTSPKSRVLLTGIGKKDADFTTIRALTIISGEMLADAQEDFKALEKVR